MTIDSTVIMKELKPASDFSNATMKVGADFLSNVIQYLGYKEPAALKSILNSGGCGIVPFAALVDDVNEFRKKLYREGSLGNTVSLACIGSEIGFDLYELLSAISEQGNFPVLQQVCESASLGAMGVKILGSMPLAVISVDEAYAQIFQRTGFLGTEPVRDGRTVERAIGACLRASEVGFAALSNIALLCEGGGGTFYVTTSAASNLFKISRMAYNSSLGG